MRARSLPVPLFLGALMVVVAGRAPAAPTPAKPQVRTGSVPAGGGLSAVSARVDAGGKRLFLRACPGLPCEPTGDGLPIELEGALDISTIKVDPVALGRSLDYDAGQYGIAALSRASI